MNADELAAHVRRVVDQAPPLTERQRAHIATLLRPGVAEDARTAPALCRPTASRERGAQDQGRAA